VSDKLSSNLDTLETTAHQAPPESYRTYCLEKCREEYETTLEAYRFLDEDDHTERAYNLEQCRTGAWFARNKISGKVRVLSSSCKLRWCPMCSATRRWHLTNQVSKWLSNAKAPKFLTLTVQHKAEPLDSQIQHLYESFRRYRRLNILKRNVAGGVWFFQIKKSDNDGLWHPHLHCVIDSPWIDKYALSAAWEVASRDSKIINIKEIRDAETMAEYVARYAARPSILATLKHVDRLELISCLHGRRLVGTWGTARSISLRPCKPPDSADWQNVGSFKLVISLLGKDDRADQLWKAFKTNSECPADCNLQDVENFIDNVQVWDHKTIEDHAQLLLDFY